MLRQKFPIAFAGIAQLLVACGGPSPTSAGGEPDREPAMPAAEVRKRWTTLTNEELDLASGMAALSIGDADAKLTRLQPLRQSAGFLEAGLGHLHPPPDLGACRARSLEGATLVKKTLDSINELWMGRIARSANPREQADALARDLCDGFAKMRSGREACAVPLPAGRAEASMVTLGCGP